MNLEQGKKLIKLARDSISAHFSNKEIDISKELKEEFGEERGVFVTLHKSSQLRGCIGFPEPVYPLWKAVVQAAMSAAFGDPRFKPLSKQEHNDKELTVEISVLTVPTLVKVKKAEEYLKKIILFFP